MLTDLVTLDAVEQRVIFEATAPPEVIILVYAGTSFREWKLGATLSMDEYRSCDDWQKRMLDHWPSAQLMRIYKVRANES